MSSISLPARDPSSNVVYGVSWNDSKKGRAATALMALLMTFVLVSATIPQGQAPLNGSRLISVIVRELRGAGPAPEQAVARMGGSVGTHIHLIHGFVARVPRAEMAALRATPGVFSVTPDGTLHLLSSSYDPGSYPGSMLNITDVIGAQRMWKARFTGKGVDIALIDSGVSPVHGLTISGKIINGPDLSFDQGYDNLRYLDEFGHGTFMAGIIAGRDEEVRSGHESLDNTDFMGIAPDARIVNVKVANAVGATDVSQVIAAISWVIQHRHDNGMNIRVLNLSFGTDSSQSYLLDPLAYAAEMAWRKGIVVVVAAGNSGLANGRLSDPAIDPSVIAVGASGTSGTLDMGDDTVPSWSSRGDGTRNPDLVAPGVSDVSLRDPGSYIDQHYPSAEVGDRFFLGSGTSEAAAVVSGAAALLIQQRPSITPDQLKSLLTSSATSLPQADAQAQGAGEINLSNAIWKATPVAAQSFPASTGLGSLDLARGTVRVQSPDGTVLSGEQDIMGTPWAPATYSASLAAETAWTGGVFNGVGWSGMGWSGMSWSGMSWSGTTWNGMGWSGMGWSGMSWSGMSWSAMGWSGTGWSGMGWSGISWSGMGWGGMSWSGMGWADYGWS
jgi:subtilisin family serine protease